MKKLLYVFFIIFGVKGFAQKDNLYGKWYLEKIDVNNTVVFTPNGLVSTISVYYLDPFNDKLIIECCSSASTEIIHDEPAKSFEIDQSLFFSEFCFNINMGNFEGLYFSVFFELDFNTSTYTYTVSQQGGLDVLVITNTSTGDQAFYQSQKLTVSQKKKVEINLYPNPVASNFQLEIESGKDIKSVRIFSVNGKEVLSFKESQSSYDVSQLSQGIYFVNIESENNKSIVKLIKK